LLEFELLSSEKWPKQKFSIHRILKNQLFSILKGKIVTVLLSKALEIFSSPFPFIVKYATRTEHNIHMLGVCVFCYGKERRDSHRAEAAIPSAAVCKPHFAPLQTRTGEKGEVVAQMKKEEQFKCKQETLDDFILP